MLDDRLKSYISNPTLVELFPSSPSYALAALTRLAHSNPQAVSGRGIRPGSSLLNGGPLSLTSVRDNSDADRGTEGREKLQ